MKRIRALRRDYQVILADPPWSYPRASSGIRGSSAKHYPTMSLTEIIDLRKFIDRLAGENCALFLWATAPLLPEALSLIKGWGFSYKTVAFNWIKLNKSNLQPFIGLGRYTRANAEFCLIGMRGKLPRLSLSVGQTMYAYRARHSKKPDEQYERIESLYEGPYIELFARRHRMKWDAWGNEI